MDRRDCFALPLILAGCGGSEMEYQIQSTPVLRTSKSVFASGVSGSWTPAISAANLGDLSVTYAVQRGTYIRFGDIVNCTFNIQANSISYTTATGFLRITGLPILPINDGISLFSGSLFFQGITKAGFTQFTPVALAGTSYFLIYASASGAGTDPVDITDLPTISTPWIIGSFWFITDSAS